MGFYTNKNRFVCPVEATLEMLSGKWKARILWKLHEKAMRFGELRRALGGVTEKVLTEQLRELESLELVRRVSHREAPPKVEYSLTAFGESLKPVFNRIAEWGAENKEKVLEIVETDAKGKFDARKNLVG